MVPPGSGSRSTTATRLPKYAAWAAAFSPAGPEPTTTKSNRPPCTAFAIDSVCPTHASWAPSTQLTSDAAAEHDLPRVRPQPHVVNLARALVVDPRLAQVLAQDA